MSANGGMPAMSHKAVIRDICSYCALHGLKSSVKAIQQESAVAFNVVQPATAASGDKQKDTKPVGGSGGLAGLQQAVLNGEWATVLEDYLDGVTLSSQALFALFEQLVTELAQNFANAAAAKIIMLQSPVMLKMKQSQPLRYDRIDAIVREAVEHQHRLVTSRGDALAALREPDEAVRAQRDAVWALIRAEVVEEPFATGAARLLANGAVSAATSSQATAGAASAPTALPAHGSTSMTVASPSSATRKVVIEGSTVAARLRADCVAVGTAEGPALLLQKDTVTGRVGVAAGASVTAMAVDVAVGPSGEVCSVWLALGLRNGAVKVYDVTEEGGGKLQRQFVAGAIHATGVDTIVFWRFNGGDGLPEDNIFAPVAAHPSLLLTTAKGEHAKLTSIRVASLTMVIGASESQACCACEVPFSNSTQVGGAFIGRESGTIVEWQVTAADVKSEKLTPPNEGAAVVIVRDNALSASQSTVGSRLVAVSASSFTRLAAATQNGSVFVFHRDTPSVPFSNPPIAVLRDVTASGVSCTSACFSLVAIPQRVRGAEPRYQWACYSVSTDAIVRTYDVGAAVEALILDGDDSDDLPAKKARRSAGGPSAGKVAVRPPIGCLSLAQETSASENAAEPSRFQGCISTAFVTQRRQWCVVDAATHAVIEIE